MKYLKLFENNQYFTEISEDEYIIHQEINDDNIDSYHFTEKELNIFKSINSNFGFYGTKKNLIGINLPFKDLYLNFFKGNDEWFYLYSSIKYDDKYYKCDQFDGIIKYLESIRHFLYES